ncbi:MAG: hypothetical protein ACFE0S_13995, partial [Rhodospirillales bacterium]
MTVNAVSAYNPVSRGAPETVSSGAPRDARVALFAGLVPYLRVRLLMTIVNTEEMRGRRSVVRWGFMEPVFPTYRNCFLALFILWMA